MQKGREKVSKQEFLDGLIDGKWAKGISNYTFSNKRINTKYCDLCRRYKDVIRYDWVFFYCQEIIQEYLEKTVTKKEKRDYLVVAEEKNKDGKYNDDISRIIFRMDKQINNKIDKHRNTYTRNGEKVDTWTVLLSSEKCTTLPT